MAKSAPALAKPDLLIWARESAGFDQHDVAAKLHVAETRIAEWEEGAERPTVKQLLRLSNIYKRSFAVFYLPERPPEAPPVHDFRCLPESEVLARSPELLLEIRKARRRRRLALELYEALGEEPPAFGLSLDVDRHSDPEQVGQQVRQALGIEYVTQVRWQGNYGYEALSNWRAAVERRGIFVFQARGVAVDEMRGFSIEDRPLPAIVLNISDRPPKGRLFTLLHELTHLLLREGGLCDLSERGSPSSEDRRAEVFCNHVAGAALVPLQNLLEERLVRQKGSDPRWSDAELGQLSSKYGASPEAVLRRLLIAERTTRDFYEAKREHFLRRYARPRPKGEAVGWAPPSRVALATAGRPFARLVLASYGRERITASDVADYLGVRLKHLDKIRADLRMHRP